MNLNLMLAIVLLIFNSSLIYIIFKNIKLLILNAAFMLITPWVWTLLLNAPTIPELIQFIPKNNSVAFSISQIISWDYLFFHPREGLFYAIGEHGYFLLSFFPSLVFGFWKILTSKKKTVVMLVLVFLFGLILSVLTSFIIGLAAVFLFLPILSIIASWGFLNFIYKLREKKSDLILKLLILVNIFWIVFEALRLFRIIQVQEMLHL